MMSDGFRLSRVYAEGWNVARALSARERDVLEDSCAAARNPYTSEPERSRWRDGFKKALGH